MYESKYLLLFLVFIYQASASFATEKYKFRTMSPDGGFYYDGIKGDRARHRRFYLGNDGLRALPF